MTDQLDVDEAIEDIHDRAEAAAGILFDLGAEAMAITIVAALRDRERFDAWIDDGPGRYRSEAGLELVTKYLEHVIKEEITNG